MENTKNVHNITWVSGMYFKMWFARVTEISECSVNDTEIYGVWCFDGLKAKSSTFRESCEKCMKSLCSSISNTDRVVPSKI